MVRNALLAASASQMKGTQAAMAVKSLGYRSAAIRGLQQASKELQIDTKSALLTLATILGLLIDDVMSQNKDFLALVRLADSWTSLNPPTNDRSHIPLRQFLLDQIQMYAIAVLSRNDILEVCIANLFYHHQKGLRRLYTHSTNLAKPTILLKRFSPRQIYFLYLAYN